MLALWRVLVTKFVLERYVVTFLKNTTCSVWIFTEHYTWRKMFHVKQFELLKLDQKFLSQNVTKNVSRETL